MEPDGAADDEHPVDEPPMDEAPVDVDVLVAEIRTEAAARRARGEYPEGLEAELSGHLERITHQACLLYTSPSPRDISGSRMPSSA